MSKILEDWNKLDCDHKSFVLRVRNGGGGKYSAEPHSIDSNIRHDPPDEEYFITIYLYDKSERSGFIECVGSWKWVVTDKYNKLEKELFQIEE